jgi:hypothetical protein
LASASTGINLGQGHHWRGVDDGDGGRDGRVRADHAIAHARQPVGQPVARELVEVDVAIGQEAERQQLVADGVALEQVARHDEVERAEEQADERRVPPRRRNAPVELHGLECTCDVTGPLVARRQPPTEDRRMASRRPLYAITAGALFGASVLIVVVTWLLLSARDSSEHGERALEQAQSHLRAGQYGAARSSAQEALDLGAQDAVGARRTLEQARVAEATQARLDVVRKHVLDRRYESAWRELSRLPRNGPVAVDIEAEREKVRQLWWTELERSARRAHADGNKRSVRTVLDQLQTLDAERALALRTSLGLAGDKEEGRP